VRIYPNGLLGSATESTCAYRPPQIPDSRRLQDLTDQQRQRSRRSSRRPIVLIPTGKSTRRNSECEKSCYADADEGRDGYPYYYRAGLVDREGPGRVCCDYSPRGKKPEKKTERGKSNQKGNTNSGEMRCGMRSGEMSWLISDRGEGSTRIDSQSSTAMAPKAPMISGAPLLANGFALEVNPVPRR
jgi:hypothetical protein